jgi:uncharacterized protein (TIGR00251 family)
MASRSVVAMNQDDPRSLHVAVRVQPGAKRTEVGGRYGDEEPPVLVVKVRARPVDGRANDAVCAAIAEAFGVRRSAVRVKNGERTRRKVVVVEAGRPERLAELLGGAAPSRG